MIKVIAACVVLIASTDTALAQIKATTEDGRAVLLMSDGMWRYVSSGKASDTNDIPAAATEKVDIWRGKARSSLTLHVGTLRKLKPVVSSSYIMTGIYMASSFRNA